MEEKIEEESVNNQQETFTDRETDVLTETGSGSSIENAVDGGEMPLETASDGPMTKDAPDDGQSAADTNDNAQPKAVSLEKPVNPYQKPENGQPQSWCQQTNDQPGDQNQPWTAKEQFSQNEQGSSYDQIYGRNGQSDSYGQNVQSSAYDQASGQNDGQDSSYNQSRQGNPYEQQYGQNEQGNPYQQQYRQNQQADSYEQQYGQNQQANSYEQQYGRNQQANPYGQQYGQNQQGNPYQQYDCKRQGNPYQQYDRQAQYSQYQQAGQGSYSNGFGIASMVLGILSLVLFCTCINVPLAIAAVIFGVLQFGRGTQGRGMAIAGIVTSVISVLALIVTIALLWRPFVQYYQEELPRLQQRPEYDREYYEDDLEDFFEFFDDGDYF